MANKGLLFIGLPESGKTTYLGALWYYIFSNPADSKYRCDSLANTELEYLNSISRSWASCEDVIRTSQVKVEKVTINMRETETDQTISLIIPDISGETFKKQFEDREWEEDFDTILENSNGILLFIDPRDKKNRPKFIYHENQHFKIFDEDYVNDNPQQTWNEDLAPSQVKLVDFLQMVDWSKPNAIKKISIIISCWDLINSDEKPEDWLAKEMPLLSQYLKSNSNIFLTKYFGISSQGGSYDTDDARELLLQKDPLQRIIINDGEKITNNILSPLLWITNED